MDSSLPSRQVAHADSVGDLPAAVRSETPLAGDPRILVLLVHGIRTHAEWFERVKRILEEGGTVRVEPLGYGFLGALGFWCPLWTRARAIRQLQIRINCALDSVVHEQLVVIGHSFGAYAITCILRENPHIRPARLLFCGGIVDNNFRWDQLPNRCRVVNDCGWRDIWPVMAQSATWGYGSSGRFGFKWPGIVDRFFDFRHSDFFQDTFVRTHWRPWVVNGDVVPSTEEAKRPTTPYWVSLLGVLRLKYIVPLIVILIVFAIHYAWPAAIGPDQTPVRWCDCEVPMAPGEFPDPTSSDPDFPDTLKVDAAAKISTELHPVLHYENSTDVDYKLLIVDCRLYHANRNTTVPETFHWWAWPFCQGERGEFNDFSAGSNYYAFFALSQDQREPIPLGARDFAAHGEYWLRVSGGGRDPNVSFQPGDGD